MGDYLIAVGVILSLMTGWIAVQRMARAFARRHPELGPLRQEGVGCGSTCGCSVTSGCRIAKRSSR